MNTLFAQAGAVNAVEVIKDRETGEGPKGFAFVTMGDADAQKAIGMFNRLFHGRTRDRGERGEAPRGTLGSPACRRIIELHNLKPRRKAGFLYAYIGRLSSEPLAVQYPHAKDRLVECLHRFRLRIRAARFA
ncbi:MAG: hypothetical protein M0C28_17455 [Candidatus Moduliflexus flocculans]|nr:hypothetical protein [Candidatus Moduliflexus flocculans]